MFQASVHHRLDVYFSENYTKRYLEFGGYFRVKPYPTFKKSPMQKYFSSGQYKELNDQELDKLWLAVKIQERYLPVAIIVLTTIYNTSQYILIEN